MSDLVSIRLSKRASEVAEQLVETGKFRDTITAAKFALAYALKNHFDEFDPEDFQVPDTDGSNYNVGSLDKDHSLYDLLKAIYPETETPYTYVRSLMTFGLMKIGDRIEAEGMPSVSELCA